MEDSYKRREQQLRNEHSLMMSHQQDKDRAVLQEKEDMVAGHKRKCDTLAQHHASELDRIKQLHKKVLKNSQFFPFHVFSHHFE